MGAPHVCEWDESLFLILATTTLIIAVPTAIKVYNCIDVVAGNIKLTVPYIRNWLHFHILMVV